MFECVEKICNETLLNSAFRDKVTLNVNLDNSVSVIYSGQKIFGCGVSRNKVFFSIKNEYLFKYADINNLDVDYEVSNLKSAPDFTRLFITHSKSIIEKTVKFLFSNIEAYLFDNYVPDSTFDCCQFYMQCSDKKRCVHTDVLYAKRCTYKRKLESGIIFFGENRKV